jgi:hypothetical protein
VAGATKHGHSVSLTKWRLQGGFSRGARRPYHETRRKQMKILALLIALMVAAPLAAKDFTIGQDAPDFQLGPNKWNTPDGFKKLSDYRGKVVLVELWATY